MALSVSCSPLKIRVVRDLVRFKAGGDRSKILMVHPVQTYPAFENDFKNINRPLRESLKPQSTRRKRNLFPMGCPFQELRVYHGLQQRQRLPRHKRG